MFDFFRGLLWWSVAVAISPITLPALLTLWTCKTFVYFLSKREKAGDLTPMKGLEVSFAADNFYSSPHGANAFVWLLEEPIDFQTVKDKVTAFLLKKNNKLDCSRLTSLRPSVYRGYPFWRPSDLKFSIENHSNIENKLIDGEKELDKYLCEYMKSPFPKDSPCWDILYIQNFRPKSDQQRAVFILRMNHVTGDGLSMLNFLSAIADPPLPTQKETQSPTHAHLPHFKRWREICNSFGEKVVQVYWTPMVISHVIKEFGFHKDFLTKRKSTKDMTLVRTQMPLETFKSIRRRLLNEEPKFGFASVATCNWILAGTLQSYFKKTNNDVRGATRLIASLPVMRSRDKLPDVSRKIENDWTHGIFLAPVSEGCRARRKKVIVEDCQRLSKLRFARVYSSLLPLYSVVPFCLLKCIVGFNMGCPVGVTNLSGPKETVTLNGTRVLSKWAIVGLQWPHAAMSAGFFSYDGNVSVTFLSNRDVIPSTEDSLQSHYHQVVQSIIKNSHS